MAECILSANVILPQGDIIHWSGRYSLVNSVPGGQISLVNNVRGDIIHSHNGITLTVKFRTPGSFEKIIFIITHFTVITCFNVVRGRVNKS